MLIQCPKCLSKLTLPDNRVKEGAKFRCSKCTEIFVYEGAALITPSPVKATTGEEHVSPSPDNVRPPQPGLPGGSALKRESRITDRVADTRTPLPESTNNNSASLSPEELARVRELQKRYAYTTAEKEKIEEKAFLQHLPDTLSFPLRGDGLIMLIVGSILFTVTLFFAKYAFIAGGFGYALVGGYIAAYMMKIVNHSAEGEPEMPDWPDISDWWDDILCPSGQMAVTALVSFSPLLLYLLFSYFMHATVSIPMILIFVLTGSFYYPIGLLSMSLFHSVSALNPVQLLPVSFRIFSDYLVAAGLCLIIVITKWLCSIFLTNIFLIGPFIDNFLMLYFGILQMRILGLMYFSNREKIAWF